MKFFLMKKTHSYRKLGFTLGVAVLGLLSSCKDEANTETTEPAQTTTTPATQNGEQPMTAQVNPQHGLPGHRCDIPVGAPLNSAAGTQQQMQTTQSNTTQSSTVSPIRVDQSPQVNPPHGQPGHDCSIPVGAELKQQ